VIIDYINFGFYLAAGAAAWMIAISRLLVSSVAYIVEPGGYLRHSYSCSKIYRATLCDVTEKSCFS